MDEAAEHNEGERSNEASRVLFTGFRRSSEASKAEVDSDIHGIKLRAAIAFPLVDRPEPGVDMAENA
jgi:hypothetical protein